LARSNVMGESNAFNTNGIMRQTVMGSTGESQISLELRHTFGVNCRRFLILF
jgi:hypothetical protein